MQLIIIVYKVSDSIDFSFDLSVTNKQYKSNWKTNLHQTIKN